MTSTRLDSGPAPWPQKKLSDCERVVVLTAEDCFSIARNSNPSEVSHLVAGVDMPYELDIGCKPASNSQYLKLVCADRGMTANFKNKKGDPKGDPATSISIARRAVPTAAGFGYVPEGATLLRR